MENIIKKVTDGVLGIAVWSSEWNTYINCYLVRNERWYFLIDTTDKDHIGNINLFYNANKFIHKNDISLIEVKDREHFKALQGENGRIFKFEWKLLGGHTPGSIALYHKRAKTLFAGDFICFFGFPLPQDGLVAEAYETRDFWYEFISSGELSKHLRAQNINPLDIARDFQKFRDYDTDYLCTGHGVVLKNNVSSFLNKLSDEIIRYENNK